MKNKQPLASADVIMNCQVALALKTLGDRWSFLIMREVFLGRYRFEGFRRRIGIARGTLTVRLNSLVEAGVLQKVPYQDLPIRYEYRVTSKGADLYPVALTAWQWEQKWAKDEKDYTPMILTHIHCGQSMRPELRCVHCINIVKAWDVRYEAGSDTNQAEPLPPRFQRRSKVKSKYPKGVDTELFHLADIYGDRWSVMIVAALFFGLRRFDEIGEAIGIATNILADRLKHLVESDILVRIAYQKKPTRYEYKLTDKGWDLYGHTLMMHQWADKWLVESDTPPLLLTHKLCGKPMHGVVVCSECSEELTLASVKFDFG